MSQIFARLIACDAVCISVLAQAWTGLLIRLPGVECHVRILFFLLLSCVSPHFIHKLYALGEKRFEMRTGGGVAGHSYMRKRVVAVGVLGM